MNNAVNHPSHYNQHPDGVEAITVSENMSANLAQALQYIWRAPFKGEMEKDIKKAHWFICRELKREKNGLANWQYCISQDGQQLCAVFSGAAKPYGKINKSSETRVFYSMLFIASADYIVTVKGQEMPMSRLALIEAGKTSLQDFVSLQGWNYENYL